MMLNSKKLPKHIIIKKIKINIQTLLVHFQKSQKTIKRKTKKLNFTGKRIGVQVVKIKRLKRIGVNSLKNLKRIKTGGSSMKRNSGKTMTLLQIRVHRRKNPNNSKQKQVRLILECKLTKACA